MTAAKASNSVLARKLEAGRKGRQGARSLLRVLRLAVARAAADEIGAPVAVIGATETHGDLDTLAERLPEDGLPILLTADDRFGAVMADRLIVSALVQHLTTGQIVSPWAEERRLTAIDAALVTPFLDGILERLAQLSEQPEDRDCVAGLRCAGPREDRRSLLLALEGDRFRLIEMSLDIGGGARQGGLTLLVPEGQQEPPDRSAPPPRPRGLEQNFGVMRAELVAVVERLRVPLARLAAMKPGDLLPLTRVRLDRTELVALDGRVIVLGKLGQAGGLRAIRLRLDTSSATAPAPELPARFEEAPHPHRATPQTDAPAAPETTAPLASSQPAALPDDDDAYEDRLLQMPPDQALAEISSLAGLSVPDTGPEAAPESAPAAAGKTEKD